MSTTRLFDQDAYLGEFEATVERSVCEGGMYRVLLDQTAFFPEGGGQPADEGTLNFCNGCTGNRRRNLAYRGSTARAGQNGSWKT